MPFWRKRKSARQQEFDKLALDRLNMGRGARDEPQAVLYYLYFPSQASADAATASLRALGMTVEVRPSASDDGTWLCMGRETAILTSKHLEERSEHLSNLASRLRGEFDGWEAATPENSAP